MAGSLAEKAQRRIGLPWSAALVDRTLLEVAGTMTAVELAVRAAKRRRQHTCSRHDGSRSGADACASVGGSGGPSGTLPPPPVVSNLAGGTHHAHADFGSGFCIINDLAVAARHAQAVCEGVERVLIFDLDVHQGDGTAAIFRQDPTVFTVSFHAKRNFPFRKSASDLDVDMENGVRDAE
jgi:acetoin utilization deacetylase AcuC-like enzyme